ncbi:2OG-Fe(II) oxygenase [archaeon]|nr:MAG: 2OG-Fe(II) oxygenase [archaeon]
MSATEGPALASITPRGKESIGSDLTEVFERCLQTKTSSDLHLERALPGVYYIDNVLTEEECNALVQQIDTSDSLTFWCKEKKEDQATRAYRNADTLEMQSAFFATELWRRIESALQSNMPPVVISDDPDDESYERDLVGEWKACGTNPLTLFVKYPCHGSFAPHTDGRAILDFNLRSHYSIILFLNSVPQECGAGTRFYAAEAVQKLQLTKHNIYSSSITTDPAKSNPSVDTSAQHWTSSPELVQGEIAAQAGRMVIFHQAWVHEGVPPIPPYQKYIIRSDVMFQRTSPICDTEPDREAYRLFRDAEWLAESGQTEEAIKLFKRAFRLSPTLAQIMGQA